MLMLPLEFVKDSTHPPLPIFPFMESPPNSPVVVTGNSEVIRPKDVLADKL